MLSRIAQEAANEIRNHDWSDAHVRADRSGHQWALDSNHQPLEKSLSPQETASVRLNVVFVTMSVLKRADPNLDLVEFARAAGVSASVSKGVIENGRRRDVGPAD